MPDDLNPDENVSEENPRAKKPKGKVRQVAGKAWETADNVGKVTEGAGQIFGAIKWVAIAICLGLVILTGSAVYKFVTAPVRAVGNAAETVTDTVKSGAETVKEGTADIIKRLVIAAPNQRALDASAERAFAALIKMPPREPSGLKERVFWTTHFGGHENKVCALSLNFGGDDISVFIAADNKDYAVAKSLGSKNDRLMRVLIRANGDDLALNTEWDAEKGAWVMKWRANTIKKSLNDKDAAKRMMDVLGAAAGQCA